MCGISGVIGEADIARMMARLRHRGPDDEGVFVDESISLGCQRLAILDRVNGRQPMRSERSGIVLVFNGEIYNYRELREELRDRCEFKGYSDSEVLLRAYEAYGAECLKRLNGMFALAVWDGKRLLLARDPFGEKPLYYYRDARRFLFASEIKSILGEIRATPVLNEDFLVFEACVGDQTLFKDVFSVPPGHYLIFDGQTLTTHRFWQEPEESIERERREESYVEELRWLLEDAVRIRMRSDVPVGMFVSGGLDSAIIACLAKPEWLYTCNYPLGPQFDELEHAQLVSEHIGRRLCVVEPRPEEFAAFLPTMMYHLDQPVATASCFSAFSLAQRASQDVKVVLQGEGADELFGGYVRYLLMCVERDLGQHEMLRNYHALAKLFWHKDVFGPPWLRYFHLIKRNEPVTDGPMKRVANGFGKYTELLNQMAAVDLEISFPSLIQMNDRATAAVAVENRLPFLDPRIATFAFRLPDHLKIRELTTKYLLRQAATGLVPEAIIRRSEKKGLVTPVSRWLNGELRDWAEKRIEAGRALLPVQPDRSRGEFDRHAYWLLTVQAWCEAFGLDLSSWVGGRRRSESAQAADVTCEPGAARSSARDDASESLGKANVL